MGVLFINWVFRIVKIDINSGIKIYVVAGIAPIIPKYEFSKILSMIYRKISVTSIINL